MIFEASLCATTYPLVTGEFSKEDNTWELSTTHSRQVSRPAEAMLKDDDLDAGGKCSRVDLINLGRMKRVFTDPLFYYLWTAMTEI